MRFSDGQHELPIRYAHDPAGPDPGVQFVQAKAPDDPGMPPPRDGLPDFDRMLDEKIKRLEKSADYANPYEKTQRGQRDQYDQTQRRIAQGRDSQRRLEQQERDLRGCCWSGCCWANCWRTLL